VRDHATVEQYTQINIQIIGTTPSTKMNSSDRLKKKMLGLLGDDDSSDEDVQFPSQSTKVNVPEVITIVDSDEEEQVPVVEAPIIVPSTSHQKAARPAARQRPKRPTLANGLPATPKDKTNISYWMPWKCPYPCCSERPLFGRSHEVENHMASCHPNARIFACEHWKKTGGTCGNKWIFLTPWKLAHHNLSATHFTKMQGNP